MDSAEEVLRMQKVMAEEIYNFTDDLKNSMQHPIKIDAGFDRIMICGMGGSAIGGDIIRDIVSGETKYPITVQRFPELPKWVDGRTFVIASSYSGNTRETLEMYRQAAERGCRIAIITSGGELEKLGKERGDIIAKMTQGLQPRSALGQGLGHLAVMVDAACGTRCSQEIGNALPALYKLRDKLTSDTSEAKRIAVEIKGRIPIIYSTAGIYSSATRWRGQINENSKMISFAGSVPEFNHNEIAGWSEGELRSKCALVFLYESRAHEAIKAMADASLAALKKYDQKVIVVRIRSRSPAQRILESVMIGDYVSLYLAQIHGVNPVEVGSINEFKSRLSKAISAVKQVGRTKK